MVNDKLFNKIDFHHENLNKKQSHLLYSNESFNKKIGLGFVNAVNKNIKASKLDAYVYFKTIRLDEVLFLRANLTDLNNNDFFWFQKIHRFLEYRLSSITKRIKINYRNKKDRVLFIQNIITLMLEYYDKSKDIRFLSISLKLLRIKSISKLSFLESSTTAQYSYNILSAYYLIREL